MKQHSHIRTDIALLLLLAIIVALIMFPILVNNPVNKGWLPIDVRTLGNVFSGASENVRMNNFVSDRLYTYVWHLFEGLMPFADGYILAHLPGALIIMTLTLCLFRFDRGFEKLSASFLASLLFLSSFLVMMTLVSSDGDLVLSALFILALMSLYHWLHHRTKKYFWLVVFSSALATAVTGIAAPLAMLILAAVFIAGTNLRDYKGYITITAALGLSVMVAFLFIYSLVGDKAVASRIFNVVYFSLVDDYTQLNILLMPFLIIMTLFPWSIPLLVSTPWLLSNPKWVVGKFRSLDMLQRFGLIIFVMSVPLLLILDEGQLPMLLIPAFFNMPLIGRYLQMQFEHHPNVWRITGAICGALIGIGTSIFVAFGLGLDVLNLSRYGLAPAAWDGWSITATVLIYISLYTLWRNLREIGRNNRYLYNIIVLYLLAEVLVFGYL